jgi:hypothetical protein
MTSDYPDYDWDKRHSTRGREDVYDYDRPLPHSGLGIFSCLVAVAVVFFSAGLFILFYIVEIRDQNGLDEDSPQAAVLFLLYMLDMGGALVGLVLGVVGAAMPNRNKLFAGLGIGANSLLLMGLIAIFIIGILTN